MEIPGKDLPGRLYPGLRLQPVLHENSAFIVGFVNEFFHHRYLAGGRIEN